MEEQNWGAAQGAFRWREVNPFTLGLPLPLRKGWKHESLLGAKEDTATLSKFVLNNRKVQKKMNNSLRFSITASFTETDTQQQKDPNEARPNQKTSRIPSHPWLRPRNLRSWSSVPSPWPQPKKVLVVLNQGRMAPVGGVWESVVRHKDWKVLWESVWRSRGKVLSILKCTEQFYAKNCPTPKWQDDSL